MLRFIFLHMERGAEPDYETNCLLRGLAKWLTKALELESQLDLRVFFHEFISHSLSTSLSTTFLPYTIYHLSPYINTV